jgi:putative transposase
MPDHLHFLCTGDDEAELIPFVRIYKSVTAFNYKRLYGNRLWQRGYYDRVLRKSDDKYFAVEYILDNPVRAGLMKEAKDYPFSKSLIE